MVYVKFLIFCSFRQKPSIPRGRICNKFGIAVCSADIINSGRFFGKSVEGYRFRRSQSSPFPFDKNSCRYRAACDRPILLYCVLVAPCILQDWSHFIHEYQGRNHRGGQGGRVPRAPYHVPLHQRDNRHQFVFGADF